jgi:hypothetical protein
MLIVPVNPAESPAGDDLESALGAVEAHLSALGKALLDRDSTAIDAHATELHRALARAVEHSTQAAHSNALAPHLRQRLMCASSQVAAQRESFARATAALDRAIDVLLPRQANGLYSSLGASERSARGGSVQA